MTQVDDSTIRERLEGMLKSDRDNLSTIDEAIAKSHTSASPRDITQKHADKVVEMTSSDTLRPVAMNML